MGTPAYLPPEAITNPESIDGRSDLYAVGAVGYHLLVGEPVFGGKTVVEVCAQHLHSEPIAPSLRTNQLVPAALERLLLRCLAKKPAARPGSAAEMMDELNGISDSNGGEFRAWTVADATRWWQDQAPAITMAVKAERTTGSTPGPGTVAIDFQRRGARVPEPLLR